MGMHGRDRVNGVKKKYGLYEATDLDKELYWPEKKLRISVTGAGGFVASHIAKRLKSEGHYVIASDWKTNEDMPEDFSVIYFTWWISGWQKTVFWSPKMSITSLIWQLIWVAWDLSSLTTL